MEAEDAALIPFGDATLVPVHTRSRPLDDDVVWPEQNAPWRMLWAAEVKAEADAIIEGAIERIHACQQKLDGKALHGPYGKQQTVETIYGAAADLRRHRLATVIKRRLMKRRGRGDSALDIVEALMVLALPNLHPAVVTNWTNAIHLAEEHHIRSWKVRGFLYAKGGINRCSALYREQLKLRE